jgi:hypothetical protein
VGEPRCDAFGDIDEIGDDRREASGLVPPCEVESKSSCDFFEQRLVVRDLATEDCDREAMAISHESVA